MYVQKHFPLIPSPCLDNTTQAYSLYVRAAASGQTPVITIQQQPTAENKNDSSSATNNARAEAETALLVTAARAHVSMGGVLDGLALLDDAAGFGGSSARARGKWGGDGEAGAGAAVLGFDDSSAVAEELCVSGGELGLRAALRLKERLAEQVRRWWLDRVAGCGGAGRGGAAPLQTSGWLTIIYLYRGRAMYAPTKWRVKACGVWSLERSCVLPSVVILHEC